jgi:hypothetical protein
MPVEPLRKPKEFIMPDPPSEPNFGVKKYLWELKVGEKTPHNGTCIAQIHITVSKEFYDDMSTAVTFSEMDPSINSQDIQDIMTRARDDFVASWNDMKKREKEFKES